MNLKKKSSVCFLLLFLLCTVQLSVPKVNAAQEDITVDKAYWVYLAKNAWSYFEPNVGVDSSSGLHKSSLSYHFFTFWDLGIYINAIIDAERLGLISSDGAWGADYRIDKVLSWLQTMELTSDNVPCLWYDAVTGSPRISHEATNVYDYGNFLIAMHRLKMAKPDLSNTIDDILKNRLNSSRLASQVKPSSSSYDFYVANGFKYFGYENDNINEAIGFIGNLTNQQKVNVYGADLPKMFITSEPLIMGMIYLTPDHSLADLTKSVYLAQEGRYNATGKFTAFSEGASGLPLYPNYVYEWIVDKDGVTWTVSPMTTPIVFFKAAVTFLALYNTPYAKEMVTTFEPQVLTTAWLLRSFAGYNEGITENDRKVETTTDKTNGLVLGAARYAIENGAFNSQSLTPATSTTPNVAISPEGTPASISPQVTSAQVSDSHSTDQSNWMIDTAAILFATLVGCYLLFSTVFSRSRRNTMRQASNNSEDGR